jgi:hypothetical protein
VQNALAYFKNHLKEKKSFMKFKSFDEKDATIEN